jgi:hypothetical protein
MNASFDAFVEEYSDLKSPKLVFAPPPSLVISMNGLGVVSKVSKLISADFY